MLVMERDVETGRKIAQQALMVLEITDGPHAAMDEEQHAWLAAHMLGLHDVQLHPASVLADGLLGHRDAGHVDGSLRL